MRVLIAVLTAVVALVACSSAQAAPSPLTITRSGGIAGIHDTLVVHPGGRGTLTHRGGDRERLAPAQTRAVRAALRVSGFLDLDAVYEPAGGVVVSDGIDYVFRARGHTVAVKELADGVPARLQRLKLAAADLMNG